METSANLFIRKGGKRRNRKNRPEISPSGSFVNWESCDGDVLMKEASTWVKDEATRRDQWSWASTLWCCWMLMVDSLPACCEDDLPACPVPSSCLIRLARWEWMCLVRWSLRLNPFPHSEQRWILSVRWMMECLCKCSWKLQNYELTIIGNHFNTIYLSLKIFATDRTSVRSLCYMRWFVSIKVFLPFKGCPTVSANEGSLTSVNG